MRWLFIILVLILIFGAFKSANARNDYLNDRGCERGSIELYSELRGTDGKYIYLDGDGNPNNNYNSYNDDIQELSESVLDGLYRAPVTLRQSILCRKIID